MNTIKAIRKFLNDTIWKVKLEDRTPLTAFMFKQLRIILIVLKNYTKDNLQLQSAGLTFYTILSVVPVVALVFAIAKGFGFQDRLEVELTNALTGHEEVVEQIMTFATRMLESTKGGLLAGVGVVVLLWTVMRLLVNIENSFNEIWQVAKGRSWVRKLTEYFSIMLLAPILIILAGSITVVITTELESFVAGSSFLERIGPVIHFMIKLIPYTLIWLLFTFVYMVMPNTKVHFKSALVAGIIAGTSFQLVEWAYINFQVGVSKYNAIYGSFAALPLFMIWVNTSWLITLIGAEIAYANQYVSEIENEFDGASLSQAQRHVIALMLMRTIVHRFDAGLPPLTGKTLSDELSLPYGVTSRVLETMVEVKMLATVSGEKSELTHYVPYTNTDNISVSTVLEALDNAGVADNPKLKSDSYERYVSRYNEIRTEAAVKSKQLLIKDLPGPEEVTKG